MEATVRQRPDASPFRLTGRQVLAAVVAALSGLACLVLATHYPLAPAAAVGIAVFCGAGFFAWPQMWLLVLPAVLPLVGFAPWTGWITFEELDILILAAAAGGYGRMAGTRRPNGGENSGTNNGPSNGLNNSVLGHHPPSQSVLVWLLAGLFAMSTAISMLRGFGDAGGFSFGWFQGYHEAMNSARLAKSLFEVLLLLPLWHLASAQNRARAENWLSTGLLIGLAAASLATIWERVAFTGLLNFSSDYRTTALFWEMHVGGAALDGFLALTLPFALREFVVARTPLRWGFAATALALAAYACLTTFSRGVYLAIPLGAAVFAALHFGSQHRQIQAAPGRADETRGDIHPTAFLLLVLGFGVGAAWMFPASGYRGMAALWLTVALMLPLARVLRSFSPVQWVWAVGLGTGAMMLAVATAWMLPKGAYFACGLAALLTAAMLVLSRQGNQASRLAGPLAFAGFAGTVAGTALVADHWSKSAGLLHAAPVLLLVALLCLVAGARSKPLWPAGLRWQGAAVAAMALVAAITGIFGGGSYMSGRFSTAEQAVGGRQAHWQMGRDMLNTPADWLLGKGMGRFPANYALAGNPKEHPGDYRIRREGDNAYLTLTGGLHINGWGEIFRITQRVSVPVKAAIVTAKVRADKDVTLHFEVCAKHLLYNNGCAIKQISLKGAPGVWQAVRLELPGDAAVRGDWYAPRLLAFSMAVETRGGSADIDNVALTRADGGQLLVNGDFSGDMAHWFFSSDRHHMPWHIKSLFMNVLFDQGVVGLALGGLLLGGALWRTCAGSARRHPLAPALAASLVGFAVVGLFDSLLDVPRLAWLFYMLLMLALTLRTGPKPVAAP